MAEHEAQDLTVLSFIFQVKFSSAILRAVRRASLNLVPSTIMAVCMGTALICVTTRVAPRYCQPCTLCFGGPLDWSAVRSRENCCVIFMTLRLWYCVVL